MAVANDNSQPDGGKSNIGNGPRRFTQQLLCPDCGQTGSALWELCPGAEDSVVNHSEGFHVEVGRTRAGEPLIICNACDTIQER